MSEIRIAAVRFSGWPPATAIQLAVVRQTKTTVRSDVVTSAAFGVYPYVLPSSVNPETSLTIFNAAAPAYGLQVGLFWFIPGMLLASAYFFYAYRNFAGKVRLDEEGY